LHGHGGEHVVVGGEFAEWSAWVRVARWVRVCQAFLIKID
jgi:hypothetical protein